MSAHHAAQVVAIALIATVVTQILYMATLGGPQPADSAAGLTNADIVRYVNDRWSEVAIVWTTEAVAFAAIALGGLTAMVRGGGSRVAWAAIALAGVFNLVQIGIGLSLFKPAALAGEEHTWVFWMIVSGAFSFYFLAKAFIGLAAIGFGLFLLKTNNAMAGKIVSGIAIIAGLAALVLNIGALGTGMSLLFPAGAAGTLAAIFAAIAGLMAAKRSES
ncbi:hypothetical protein QWY75_09165 [Pontixanthobacter aestiaquae]|uniref:DUF4386 family protein n=1 Tax=Pontixanthobacter aestiaquae TaxID=1509367 RepID=A0A844Z571_9SPHN|nr:hypothetical protein [Pontixanthobacter aestiaquae]MDN3646367.1 hypothetical protein [Pontixanthobacter aestiaquae]MXO82644.1 hypothetical protein [Pontixanthobacter aestiaquae]